MNQEALHRQADLSLRDTMDSRRRLVRDHASCRYVPTLLSLASIAIIFFALINGGGWGKQLSLGPWLFPDNSNFHHRLLANPEELPRFAYFVQCTSQRSSMLPKLIEAVFDPENVYYIHFQQGTPSWDSDMAKALKQKYLEQGHNNIHIVQPSVVGYGSSTMTLNMLEAMQVSLDGPTSIRYLSYKPYRESKDILSEGYEPPGWDYWINLSCSDYPLMSQNMMRSMFRKWHRRDTNIIEQSDEAAETEKRWCHPMTDPSLSGRPEVDMAGYKHECAQELRWPLPRDFNIRKGEEWVVVSRRLARWIVDSPKVRRLLVALAHTLYSDEHFWSSIPGLVQSEIQEVIAQKLESRKEHWARAGTPDRGEISHVTAVHKGTTWLRPLFISASRALRLIIWRFQGLDGGLHPYVLDDGIHGDTVRDYLSTTPALFGRKFSPDSQVVGLIDVTYLNEGWDQWPAYKAYAETWVSQVSHISDVELAREDTVYINAESSKAMKLAEFHPKVHKTIKAMPVT